MTAKRAALWISWCAVAGFAPPTVAQKPCTDPLLHNCEYFEYQWIERGSAPKREKSHTEQLIEEYKSRPPPTPEELEREHKRQVEAEIQRTIDAANDRFYREQATRRRTVALLPKTGTCPAGAGVVEGTSARDSYHRTREACLVGYPGPCEALTKVCQGDPLMASDAGRCYFGPPQDYERSYARPRDELLSELRRKESACVDGREAGACMDAALSHTFAIIPEANPQNAYYYVALGCKYGKPYQPVPSSRPEVLECTAKLTDCYFGAPAASRPAPAPPVQPAARSPPVQPANLAPGPLRLPEPKGRCDLNVTSGERDSANRYKPEGRLQRLRRNEQGCLEDRQAFSCSNAALDHMTLDIPEADPRKGWGFMTLACELDVYNCEAKKRMCVPG